MWISTVGELDVGEQTLSGNGKVVKCYSWIFTVGEYTISDLYCTVLYMSRFSGSYHMNIRTFICLYCREACWTERDIKSHIKSDHPMDRMWWGDLRPQKLDGILKHLVSQCHAVILQNIISCIHPRTDSHYIILYLQIRSFQYVMKHKKCDFINYEWMNEFWPDAKSLPTYAEVSMHSAIKSGR